VPVFKIADDRFDDCACRASWSMADRAPDRIVAAAVDAVSFHEVTRFFEKLFGISRSFRGRPNKAALLRVKPGAS
jgi:hypothetical protein